MVFVLGNFCCISRAALRPLIVGMEMSITTISGFADSASRSPSCPSEASPTTWNPSRSSRLFKPWRTSTWSSTSRMRTGMFSLHWHSNQKFRSSPRRGLDQQRSPYRAHSFSHRNQSQSLPPRCSSKRPRVKPVPVVLHGATQLPLLVPRVDPHVLRLRVFHYVPQRLLHHSIQSRLRCAWQPLGHRRPDVNRNPGTLR